ncbi:MAG: ribonucleoside triphosphate reductase [Petrotogales bacterium]
MKYVRKRNGRLQEFDKERIYKALLQAIIAVGEENSEQKAKALTYKVQKSLLDEFGKEGVPTVEEIQDLVEQTLIQEGMVRTAKAYILYRKQHQDLRELATILSQDDLIDKYILKSDWRVRENSNMNFSLQGLNNYISSNLISKYWLNRVYPENIRKGHNSGELHIHDLAVLGPYCVGWDLPDLLLSGFKGVAGKVESSPAKHLSSALGQIVNFFYTLQGEAAGAQAFSNFDSYLAPFIRYDGLDEVQLKQKLQEWLFNMNIPTRVGFQTPFTNISLDIKVPDFLKNEPVILGGKLRDETYGDIQEEMNLFNQCFAEVMTQGDAKGRVFTFPIATYSITDDFEWESKTSEAIFKMTAKYGTPYFSNFVNSDINPDDVRSMCCRLRIDNRELKKRGGGLFGSNPLTGSIGVVTLNLPRVGYTQKNETELYEKIGNLMDTARDSLEIKRKILEKFTDKGLYPYSAYYLRNIKKAFDSYWNNHFSTIGLVGMAEAVQNFLGTSIASSEGMNLSEKILRFMRNRLSDYQEETGNIYNLEATPAEGTSYRLAKLDRSRYPGIMVANQDQVKNGAEPFYTNSTQLPVDQTNDLFEALEHQNHLQPLYTGGTVFHTFLGESLPSWKSAAKLVKKITSNSRLPYLTLTPTFSICPIHGYIKGEHHYCPKCKENCEVYSRVVGYLRPVNQWNDGKQAEFSNRKTFETTQWTSVVQR